MNNKNEPTGVLPWAQFNYADNKGFRGWRTVGSIFSQEHDHHWLLIVGLVFNRLGLSLDELEADGMDWGQPADDNSNYHDKQPAHKG